MINLFKRIFNSENITEISNSYIDIREANNNIKIQPRKIGQHSKIFDDIIGHDSLKIVFQNALEANEPVHILLTGAAGTAKSLFLEAISDNVKDSYMLNNNSTGAGILKYLYEHPKCKYLCIDEVEKLKKDELAVLLTLMESGKLIIQKQTMSCNRKMKLSIFATSNDMYRLAPEMRSRLLRFHLQPYTHLEFMTVATNIVTKRFKKSKEFADKVANMVWNDMGSRDIRDVIKVTRLCKNYHDIENIIKALSYYSEKTEENNNEKVNK